MSEGWIDSPELAHEQWRLSLSVGKDARAYSERALLQYKSIWSVFCRWMRSENVTVATVSGQQIAAFLGSLSGRRKIVDSPAPLASARTQRMYAVEIGLVFSKLVLDGIRQDNPLTSILMTMKMVNPTPRANAHLPPPQLRQYFFAWLEARPPSQLDDHALAQYCMSILMMDCGATHKEIQKLTVNSVRSDILHLPGHRSLAQRDVPLTDLASRLLSAWLERRAGMVALTEPAYKRAMRLPLADRRVLAKSVVALIADNNAESKQAFSVATQALLGSDPPILSSKLFVRTGSRKLNSAVELSSRPALNTIARFTLAKVDDRSVYAAAKMLLLHAPEHLLREYARGPQTLRNAYCAALLAQGVSDQEIKQRMGLSSDHTLRAVRKAML